jgi:serine/threonine protein kinase
MNQLQTTSIDGTPSGAAAAAATVVEPSAPIPTPAAGVPAPQSTPSPADMHAAPPPPPSTPVHALASDVKADAKTATIPLPSSSSVSARTLIRLPRKAEPVDSKRGPMHSFSMYGSKFTVDSHYMPVQPIGKGAFGTVCAAVDEKTGRRVAIKKIANAFDNIDAAVRTIRELRILRHLSGHPNIIGLYDIIEPPAHRPSDDVYLVFELMDFDLRRCLKSSASELTPRHYRFFTYQMLCGLKAMHSAFTWHRDIVCTPLHIRVASFRLTDSPVVYPRNQEICWSTRRVI